MTLEELSNEFDVLINSNSSLESFGHQLDPLKFDEYEKSVHLTKAQEELIAQLYSSVSGFESTEQIRRYLGNLVESDTIDTYDYNKGVSSNSVYAELPKDLMYITYESATINGDSDCLNNKTVQVIPVTQDEYHRIKENPFRKPNSRKVLRLDLGDNRVELVSDKNINVSKYYVRYLRRPYPIILTDLTDGLTINKENKSKQCELSPELHRMILQVAVTNALQSRSQGKSN